MFQLQFLCVGPPSLQMGMASQIFSQAGIHSVCASAATELCVELGTSYSRSHCMTIHYWHSGHYILVESGKRPTEDTTKSSGLVVSLHIAQAQSHIVNMLLLLSAFQYYFHLVW